jgi:hypothetical protein
MPGRESDLSIFAEVIPDEFVEDTRRWYDDIPDMPEPGHGRFEAGRTYQRIVDAFTETQQMKQQLTSEDVTRIFDTDKQGIDELRHLATFNPSLDYSLSNVLAIGVWYERAEFEKEEGITPRCQTLGQVNSLIRQTLDLAAPQTPSTPGK